MLGDQLGRQFLDIAKQQGSSFAVRKNRQTFFQISPVLGAEQRLLGRFGRLTQRFDKAVDLAEIYFAVTAQKIDGRVARDAREPVRRLVQFLELILPLERLDKGLLGEILGVVNVPDDPVDQPEDAA